MATVHPAAVVDSAAQLADSVSVGPFCVIGPQVTIGADTQLGPGCVVHGPTEIGSGNQFHGNATIGGASQAKKGAAGRLRIGDGNVVREYVTINRGSDADAITVVGHNNWLMACSHVAHDCIVGDDTVIANAVLLGGEVSVASKAILGGGAAFHQHCRVGTLAIIGGATVVRQDVPPYANYTVADSRVTLGINKIGLERAGHGAAVATIKSAYAVLYHQGLRLEEAVTKLTELATAEPLLEPLAQFVAAPSKYGLVRPRAKH